MRFFRYFVLGSFLIVVFSSVMVVRQFIVNQSQHEEMREAFLVLCDKGYTDESLRLYQRLLLRLQETPRKNLIEDLQRTAMLVNPAEPKSDNLVWKYHWSVKNELEKRTTVELAKALKTARNP
ncbi:MAG: hypothetical protein ABJC04_03780 [Verrucomicrobiota bacterium]